MWSLVGDGVLTTTTTNTTTKGSWQKNAYPSYCDILRFLTGTEHVVQAANWPRKVPFDWTLLGFIALCIVLPIMAFRLFFFVLERIRIEW